VKVRVGEGVLVGTAVGAASTETTVGVPVVVAARTGGGIATATGGTAVTVGVSTVPDRMLGTLLGPSLDMVGAVTGMAVTAVTGTATVEAGAVVVTLTISATAGGQPQVVRKSGNNRILSSLHFSGGISPLSPAASIASHGTCAFVDSRTSTVVYACVRPMSSTTNYIIHVWTKNIPMTC
jgi:hypothetical protein